MTLTRRLRALVRREGLYATHVSAWRRERDRGALDALGRRRRGEGWPTPPPREGV